MKLFLNTLLISLIIFNCNNQGNCITGDCVNGRGKMIWSNNRIYDGDWKGGEPHGYGVEIYQNSKYDGEWRNGKKYGFAKYKNFLGNYYEGNIKNGLRDGEGYLVYKSGDTYRGTWKDNLYPLNEAILL